MRLLNPTPLRLAAAWNDAPPSIKMAACSSAAILIRTRGLSVACVTQSTIAASAAEKRRSSRHSAKTADVMGRPGISR